MIQIINYLPRLGNNTTPELVTCLLNICLTNDACYIYVMPMAGNEILVCISVRICLDKKKNKFGIS